MSSIQDECYETRLIDTVPIVVRRSDLYVDGTRMCSAFGRLLKEYRKLVSTERFLNVLTEMTGLGGDGKLMNAFLVIHMWIELYPPP
jgi:hypothetical protein